MWAQNCGGGVELRSRKVRLTHNVRLKDVLSRKLTLQLLLFCERSSSAKRRMRLLKSHLVLCTVKCFSYNAY